MLGRCKNSQVLRMVTRCPRPNGLANYQVSVGLDFFLSLKRKSLIAFHQKTHTLDWASFHVFHSFDCLVQSVRQEDK